MILERESWTTRKREKYANALVDRMEGTGAIRTFYNELKENQKAVRANMVSCYLSLEDKRRVVLLIKLQAQGDYVH